ncbi:MAG TPA: cyclase family protein, partial [Solirubrobacterales bacterium]|nr:cyclase family protein [Solirubrobacterales bacterium]
MSRLIDLSAPIEPGPEGAPEVVRIDVEYTPHEEGAKQIQALFGVGPELLRDGEGWAVDTFTLLGTHSSTHVDAPWHYNSTIQGKPAETIDQLPLDWFYRPGFLLDFHERADGEVVEIADIEAELRRTGHEIAERDICLVRTGCDQYLGTLEYMAHGPGVSAAATRWLYDRGVRV